MLKLIVITMVSLVSVSAFAKSKEVMGVLARCDCRESTIDGDRNLGKVTNDSPTRSEQNARNQASVACSNRASDSLSVSISNCQYIKVIDEKVSATKFKRRVERIKDDEENNLANDLLSTL